MGGGVVTTQNWSSGKYQGAPSLRKVDIDTVSLVGSYLQRIGVVGLFTIKVIIFGVGLVDGMQINCLPGSSLAKH